MKCKKCGCDIKDMYISVETFGRKVAVVEIKCNCGNRHIEKLEK